MIPYRANRLYAAPQTLEKRLEIAKAIRKLLDHDTVEKFDPDQARVPAGNPDGGQWTDANGDQSNGSSNPQIVVAARNKALETECDAQYDRDIDLCNIVRTPLCYQRAMARYNACMREEPLPPLRF
jgi:hypothetical protein